MVTLELLEEMERDLADALEKLDELEEDIELKQDLGDDITEDQKEFRTLVLKAEKTQKAIDKWKKRKLGNKSGTTSNK